MLQILKPTCTNRCPSQPGLWFNLTPGASCHPDIPCAAASPSASVSLVHDASEKKWLLRRRRPPLPVSLLFGMPASYGTGQGVPVERPYVVKRRWQRLRRALHWQRRIFIFVSTVAVPLSREHSLSVSCVGDAHLA